MASLRRSADVVSQLLEFMQATVTSFHPTVGRTGRNLDELIAGTACFPGGTGLWRGRENGGPLPEFFPIRPVMFVAHNFDSQRGYEKSLARKGEGTGTFWTRLLMLIEAADASPNEFFFTNVLMGLKPGSATGPMPKAFGYLPQCSAFLKRQAEIVDARAVIALGENAEPYVKTLQLPWMRAKHPGDWHFRELTTRAERMSDQGCLLRAFLDVNP